ncbi:MAG: carboxypeptidase-like regulatory domain-containing protein [Dyadobacter sp.]|uniref:carboxypeptidase-like regulatory domain-containing protein n=1 Tax=Dyadobacter sp. TaxID=1914288 RepID=UPI0032656DCB
MKQKPIISHPKPFSPLYATILFGGLALLLSDCFLKQDGTTTIYGTVTDQNGLPVDSILVTFSGVQDFKYEQLKETFSDKNGNYEMVVEVPKRYSSALGNIPYSSKNNPKYKRGYRDFYSKKNGISTGSCCFASIGEKTKYDFQLIPK